MLLVMIVDMMAMFMMLMMMTNKSSSRTCCLERRERGYSPISSRLRMITIEIHLIVQLNWMVSQYFVCVVFVMLLKLTTNIVYLELCTA